MKKILAIIILFFLSFWNIFAEIKAELWREIFEGNYDWTLSKIDFSWKKFELLRTSIYLTDKEKIEEYFENIWKKVEEWKIDYFPEILKKIPRERAEILIKENKLQIYWQLFWICWPMDPTQEDQICVYDKSFKFNPNYTVSDLYKIYSDKNEKIKVTFYPISPDYFPYYRYYSEKTPLLTIFTNNLDIYNPKMKLYKKLFWFEYYQDNFQKNYKIFKMSYGNYIYVPYYTTEIYLEKWENFLKFDYQKFWKKTHNQFSTFLER